MSKADTVQGQGVLSAHDEQVKLVKEQLGDEFTVLENSHSFCDITHYHTINPQFLFGLPFAKHKGTAVGYVHFLPETLENSIKLPPLVKKAFYWYVMRFYKSMDYLVTVNPYFIDRLEAYGVDRDKVSYIPNLSQQIPADKRIMITFGGGSVKTNGVYEQVIQALEGRDYTEFWGIESNPDISTLKKAIESGKEKNIDFLLAVGGGSVIDGTKLISAGIPYDGDAWELVKKGSAQNTIPLGTVLTIPATGSEMNNGAVISCRETHEKYPFFSSHPVFSILDPTVTFSLPDYQIACGLADTFVHVMEQYMTKTNESYLMDRWSESILRTLVQIAPQIKENKQDYHLMSEFMMSATMALNGFIAMGVSEDWATHMIGHELTALHGMTHGQTLAIVFPGTLRTLADKKRDKILQYGERIWGVTSGVPSVRVSLTIEKTEEFFRNLGLKTRLDEAGIGDDTIEEIVRRFNERGAAYGEDGDVTGEVARRILQNCKSKKETTDTEGTSMKTVILTSFKSDVRAHMLQDQLSPFNLI